MTISIIKNNIRKYNNAAHKHVPLFVKFYSKKCGACIEMQQEWIQFTHQLKQYQGNVVIAEIETKHLHKLHGFNQVSLVPTIVLLKDGSVIDEYQLPRTAKSFIQYLKYNKLIHKHTQRRRIRKHRTKKHRRRIQ